MLLVNSRIPLLVVGSVSNASVDEEILLKIETVIQRIEKEMEICVEKYN